MINKIKVTNYLGDSIDLVLTNPEASGFAITNIDGLGPAKANINLTDISTSDGALYNSARVETRNVVFGLIFMGASIEEIRRRSYRYFPVKKEVTLEIFTDNRSAKISGYVESNEPTIFSEREGCQISIICPDPFLVSTEDGGFIKVVFSGVEGKFEFPFENNSLLEPLIEFGSIAHIKESGIYYAGDVENGVVLTIHATDAASNVRIYNTMTNESMFIDTDKLAQLTGSGLIAGDTIEICTKRGNKYIKLIRNSLETNILNCLDRNSDWFQLARGENTFTYTCEEGDVNIQFTVQSELLYEGI